MNISGNQLIATARNPRSSEPLPLQPRPMQQPNKMVYMLQTQPDGSQVLVPHPQYQQNQQIVRIQQKIAQPQPQQQQQHQQQYQVVQNQLTEMVQEQPQPQPQQPMPRQMPPPPEEPVHVPPTTSTFTPKKDGDCDDLEESITATAISKSARSSEPPPLQPQSGSISIDDYRKRLLQPNRVGMVRPTMNTAGNQLRAPPRNPALQVIRQRPAPRPQYQLQGAAQEVDIQERESAKMLVILDNGEQRLITFTLPKETCTVQELLDKVGIQVGADSNIECIENPGSEIDYIVKVGNFGPRDIAAMTKAAENHIRQQQVRQQQLIQNQRNSILQHQQQTSPQATPSQPEVSASQSPEPKVVPPKYVAGFFAVCTACGCSGVDHAKCMGCHRVFTEEPKMLRMPSTNIQTPQKLSLPVITSPNQTIKILTTAVEKKDHIEALLKNDQMTSAQKQGAGRGGRGGATVVPEIVTLSSDEEDGSDESKSSAKKPEEIVPKKRLEPQKLSLPVATGTNQTIQPIQIEQADQMTDTVGHLVGAIGRNPALQLALRRPARMESECAKMLVVLDNGEQRLITFTLPKETCTVQEFLEFQVGIQVDAESSALCIEKVEMIDYIVKLGNFPMRDTAALITSTQNHIRQQQQQQNQRNSTVQHADPQNATATFELEQSASQRPGFVWSNAYGSRDQITQQDLKMQCEPPNDCPLREIKTEIKTEIVDKSG